MSERLLTEIEEEDLKFRIDWDDLVRVFSALFLYILSLASYLVAVSTVVDLYRLHYIPAGDEFVIIQSCLLFLHVLTAIFIIKEAWDTWESRKRW